MEKNRTLITLVILYIALSPDSLALPDSDSSAGTNCSYSDISIHSIQGAEHKSPIAGCFVSGIKGIVILNTSNGFYMQDPHPDNDNSTSEGIFVYTALAPIDVQKGDLASVDGTVYEYSRNTKPLSLSVTEIVDPTYTTKHSNITLTPALIGIGGLVPPDTVIEDDAFGDIAVENSFDPGTNAIDFYESLEGMSVLINDAVVVGPDEPDRFTSRTVVYVLGDNGSLAGIRTPHGGIISKPCDFNPERIALDFYASSSEPVDVGDLIKGPIAGALDYSDYNFRIFVDENTPLAVSHVRVLGSRNISRNENRNENRTEKRNGTGTQMATGDQIAIAAFNVLDLSSKNLTNKRFERLAQQIINDLGAPDIIALEEITGDGVQKDGSGIYRTLNLLTENISIASNGQVQYSNISIPDKSSNMNVAILYRSDRGLGFKCLSAGETDEDVAVISGPHLSPNPGRIYPGDPAFEKNMRKPLAAEFTFHGQSLFVIANHLKSKSGDERLFGEFQPPRTFTEDRRHKQARIVHDFVREILNADPMANVVVLGDFNDFQFSETLNILKGDILTNPLENLPVEEQYTFNFEGNSQAIDHILISKNLANTSPEFKVAHINSDFGMQSSDHDPVELRIEFP